MPQFIDYVLLNYYVGNQDWGENKNWYAIRNRSEQWTLSNTSSGTANKYSMM